MIKTTKEIMNEVSYESKLRNPPEYIDLNKQWADVEKLKSLMIMIGDMNKAELMTMCFQNTKQYEDIMNIWKEFKLKEGKE